MSSGHGGFLTFWDGEPDDGTMPAGPTQSGCPLSGREARHVSPLTATPAPSGALAEAQPPVVSLASSRTTHPVPSVSSSHPSGSATPLRGLP